MGHMNDAVMMDKVYTFSLFWREDLSQEPSLYFLIQLIFLTQMTINK